MDASRLFNPESTLGIEPIQAARISLANDLRDLADQIENGQRVVRDFQTFERIMVGGPPLSIMQLTSARADNMEAL